MKLEQLQILKCRTVGDGADVNELANLKLGWEGEIQMDMMIDCAIRGRNCIHMKDYRFAVNGEVQIDNVLIAGDRIFTFEVKKYNFDLIYSDEVWTFTNGEKFKKSDAAGVTAE
ncbi:Nuclease-related domain-containing protein [Lacicoccus alkaliphilus]|uniref:Nuclease-related domain-containing protein n=1 Tax=Lacicoccus alkaliphilus DSM 16010 TaxID=1123231 RepID=A0A1M7FCF4_9BACL|nr:Nuclease-related domain-containing protein [Salinicoccus alkaliphilus DSM 16010]